MNCNLVATAKVEWTRRLGVLKTAVRQAEEMTAELNLLEGLESKMREVARMMLDEGFSKLDLEQVVADEVKKDEKREARNARARAARARRITWAERELIESDRYLDAIRSVRPRVDSLREAKDLVDAERCRLGLHGLNCNFGREHVA